MHLNPPIEFHVLHTINCSYIPELEIFFWFSDSLITTMPRLLLLMLPLLLMLLTSGKSGRRRRRRNRLD
jgi:hypothetical protein